MKKINISILLGLLTTSLFGQVTDTGDKVGIGISNPSFKLHISSPDNQLMRFTSTNGTWLDFESTNAGVGSRIWTIGHVGVNGNFGIAQRDGIDDYRLVVDKNGKVGIGTTQPLKKLDVRGSMILETGSNPSIFTGTGTAELNRFLSILNSPNKTSASGLKAGGILVSDVYSFANPGKNDLIVKGKIGVGTPSPEHGLHVKGNMVLEASSNPIIYTGIGSNELNRYVSLINSTGHGSASGLKAGGILVSDSYSYANPSKNNLIVKGEVGIGTTTLDPAYKLSVNGSIRSKEVKVEANWSDFVFYDNYDLRTIEEVEQHINENGHLPEIPSEAEVTENGINLGEMDAKLLQKIEELTLYMIDMNKRMKEIETENIELKEKVQSLENQ